MTIQRMTDKSLNSPAVAIVIGRVERETECEFDPTAADGLRVPTRRFGMCDVVDAWVSSGDGPSVEQVPGNRVEFAAFPVEIPGYRRKKGGAENLRKKTACM